MKISTLYKRPGVRITDEELFKKAQQNIEKFIKDRDNEKIRDDLKKTEGYLWERYKRLRGWATCSGNLNTDENLTILQRKKKCSEMINKIRIVLGDEPYNIN